MAIYFPENRIPEKARVNRFARIPIISFALLKTLLGKNVMGVNDAIDGFHWQTDITKHYKLLWLKLKLVYYRYAYEFMFYEFVNFGFENKSKKECLKYISSFERIRLLNELYVDTEEWQIFANKDRTYNHYAKFFKRDVICIYGLEDLVKYTEFIKKHSKFIVKPIKENNGRGIFIVDLEKDNLKAMDVFNRCLSLNGVLVEEYISQTFELSQIFPNSVNTVRFVTYYSDGNLTNIAAFLRVGVGNSVIDNATNGGIFAGIDISSGRIITDGYKKTVDDIYEYHPDTNIKFKGFKLPEWDKLLNLIEDIVKVCPKQKFVGWDFAHGENGWMLVEANGGPGLVSVQISNQKGLRPIFSKTIFLDSKNASGYISAKL